MSVMTDRYVLAILRFCKGAFVGDLFNLMPGGDEDRLETASKYSSSVEVGTESPVNEQLWNFRLRFLIEAGGKGGASSGVTSDSLLLLPEFSDTPESAVS